MQQTGVIIRRRDNGADFAFHADCADAFLERVNYNPLDDDSLITVIGPLFASESEWKCTSCIHSETKD